MNSPECNSGLTTDYSSANFGRVNANRATISGLAVEQVLDTEENVAPVAALSASPDANVTTETAVQFSSAGSTDDKGIVSYAWNFGDGSPISTEENPTYTFTETGTFTVSLEVTDEEGSSDTETIEVEVFEPVSEVDFSLYINAGSSADAPYEGKLFVGDQKTPEIYNSDRTYTNTGVSSSLMLQSNRNSKTGNLVYTKPVPNGIYKVSTYHIESYLGVVLNPTNIRRVFDVIIEDELKNAGFNLYPESGNTVAKIENEGIVVIDGELKIEIKSVVGAPVISGIAIEGFVDVNTEAFRVSEVPMIVASPLVGSGPLKVDFTGDLTGVDQGALSYEYDFGDGVISTEKNPSHMFVAPGSYEVKVTVRDGKSLLTEETITIQVDKSNEAAFNTDSGFGESSIRMYPNPASDIVNLLVSDPEVKLGEISIFDVRGRMVQSYIPEMAENGNKYTISVRGIAAGVYFVTTTTEGGITELQRLIVVK